MLDLKWVVLDFETASAVNLKKAGAWRYAEDPTTEILCLSYSLMGQPVQGWCPGLISRELMALVLDRSVTFIAHGAGFEKAIWRKIMVEVYGWPDIPDERWHCTMAVAAMKVLPQDLEKCVRVLGLDQEKDMEGSRLTVSLSKPRKDGSYDRAPATIERVQQYCDQDIHTELALHKRIGWFQPGERRVWLLDQHINQRGLQLDMQFVRAAQKIVDEASGPLLTEFRALTGINHTQRDKFIAWLDAQDVRLPDMKKETLAELLGDNDGDEDEDRERSELLADALPANADRALRIKQLVGSASIKKLGRMEACVCADGRARGLLQYHGAGPGRWAGRLLQPQNFPRGSIKASVAAKVDAILTGDWQYVEALIGPAVETVVSSLRHAIIAGDARRLVAGDFAGIEARVCLALAGEHEKCAIMASGQDIYCDMATDIYGRPITKADTEERQTGKNSVLGLGFQMGVQKFWERYCPKQPREFAEKVVMTYRKVWAPKVPKLWYGLEDAAVMTVHEKTPHEAFGVLYQLEDGWLTARLPSGRKLWYYNPQPTRVQAPWDKDEIKLAFTYQAMKMGRWITVHAFGGLLTENVVQGLARDLMVAAMFKCEENGLPICLTVHDEIVTEPETINADPKALQQIMADTPSWGRALQIPVAAETWAGDRYKK